MNYDNDKADQARGPVSFHWDANTAAAVTVLAALAFLWAVAKGFRGVSFGLGD